VTISIDSLYWVTWVSRVDYFTSFSSSFCFVTLFVNFFTLQFSIINPVSFVSLQFRTLFIRYIFVAANLGLPASSSLTPVSALVSNCCISLTCSAVTALIAICWCKWRHLYLLLNTHTHSIWNTSLDLIVYLSSDLHLTHNKWSRKRSLGRASSGHNWCTYTCAKGTSFITFPFQITAFHSRFSAIFHHFSVNFVCHFNKLVMALIRLSAMLSSLKAALSCSQPVSSNSL
jgi:hypothetical protein